MVKDLPPKMGGGRNQTSWPATFLHARGSNIALKEKIVDSNFKKGGKGTIRIINFMKLYFKELGGRFETREEQGFPKGEW